MQRTKEILKYFFCCECLKNNKEKSRPQTSVSNDNKGFSLSGDTVVQYQPNVEFDANQNTFQSLPTDYSTKNSMNDIIPTLKIMLLGDGGVGKSSLILQYMYREFLEDYEPTKADSYRKTIALNGEQVIVDILDTAGQEDYQAIQDNQLKRRQGFLLVFDLTHQESFERIVYHIENLMRIKNEEESKLVILVGNKCDLIEDRQVSSEEAYELAKRYAIDYIETSALTAHNVDRAFSQIFLKVLFKKYPNKCQKTQNQQMTSNPSNFLTKKPTFMEIFSTPELNEIE